MVIGLNLYYELDEWVRSGKEADSIGDLSWY